MCVDPHHLNRLVPAEGSSTEVVPPVKNYFRRFFYVIFCINNREWGSTHDSGICCSGSDFNCVDCACDSSGKEREKGKEENGDKAACVLCDGSSTCDGDIYAKGLFFPIRRFYYIVQHVIHLLCRLCVWSGNRNFDRCCIWCTAIYY